MAVLELNAGLQAASALRSVQGHVAIRDWRKCGGDVMRKRNNCVSRTWIAVS